MVIDDDDVHSELGSGIDLRHRGHATVGRHHEPRPSLREPPECVEVQTVSLDQSIRDVVVDARRRPATRSEVGEGAQHGDEERRAGDAVDVVVAVDADRLARLERARQPRDGSVDALERERVGQMLERRFEEPLRLLGVAQSARPERASDGGQQPQLGCQTTALLCSGGGRRLSW